MLKALAPGDTVIITRLDRLARSTLDLLHTVDAITKAGAGFRSLADAIIIELVKAPKRVRSCSPRKR
jgi:DNA invertase Pin-like site-specific DNA recombinase